MPVVIRWDESAIRVDCADPNSAIGQGLSLIADRLVMAMKARCPVARHDFPGSTAAHPRQGPPRKSGTLRSSIRKIRQADGSYLVGPTDTTASGDSIGAMVEKGTPAHDIDSTGPWSLYSISADRYFGRHVHHPGTKARPFIGPAVGDLANTRIRLGR